MPSAFLEAIISFLMPYFIGTAVDISAARTEIIETLAAYATRTRTEMLQAAQIIAFAMSTLDTLAEAKAADLSPSLRIRFRGCANNLNRSASQHQTALDRSLACDLSPTPEPADDVADAQLHDSIDNARAAIDTCRNRLVGAHAIAADSVTVRQRNDRLCAGAMMHTLNQMRLPNEPAQGG
jgi:hypothetical protein